MRFSCICLLLMLLLPSGARTAPEDLAITEPAITQAQRSHWSFQPLVRPALPQVQVRNGVWVRNPVDRFILARLQGRGLDPAPAADGRTLIRRVTFDLTGLPPGPTDVAGYIADDSPDAWERLLDRLLADPAHGQRWARHWLDLARFAETDGFEHDKVRPEAWRYRDWVIEAINRDCPYDRFIQLQLAGDEVDGEQPASALATGFLLAGQDMPDLNDQDQRRGQVLNEMTATVGEVFLGLQMGCAACHDHKYDPISQADFYRLRAFFENAIVTKRDQPLGSTVREPGPIPGPSRLWIRGDPHRPGPLLDPGFPRIVGDLGREIPKALGQDSSSRRRMALADWMGRPNHPLVGRVIANRLWHHHMGRPIVATPGDFGAMGDKPSHSDLLDYLATEVGRLSFSLKRMHRLILTSATYRQAGRGLESDPRWVRGMAEDPANTLYWRMNRRRLEAEAIRDAMLQSAGVLSLRHGGPSVLPPLPQEVLATLLSPDHWTVSANPADHFRRSIYIFARRNLRYPILQAFDGAESHAACSRREVSTTAPQALMLLNGELSLDAARRMAGRALGEVPLQTLATPERIIFCWELALGRPPTIQEARWSDRFLQDQALLIKQESRAGHQLALPEPAPAGLDPSMAAAWTDLCLGLYNLNEFIYVD